MARPNTRSRAAGLRATLVTSGAEDVADTHADARERDNGKPGTNHLGGSEIHSPVSFRYPVARADDQPGCSEIEGGSVQVHRVVQIDAGQHGKHVGLQGRHQQFEADQDDD